MGSDPLGRSETGEGAGDGRVGAEPAIRMQIPGGVAGRRGPAGKIVQAAGTSNEHPNPGKWCAVGESVDLRCVIAADPQTAG